MNLRIYIAAHNYPQTGLNKKNVYMPYVTDWIDMSMIPNNKLHKSLKNCIYLLRDNPSNWDMSRYTNLKNWFAYISIAADLSRWDLTNVRIMSGAFMGTKWADHRYSAVLNNWKLPNLQYVSYLFSGTHLFTDSKLDVSDWQIRKLEYSYRMLTAAFHDSIIIPKNHNVPDANIIDSRKYNFIKEYVILDKLSQFNTWPITCDYLGIDVNNYNEYRYMVIDVSAATWITNFAYKYWMEIIILNIDQHCMDKSLSTIKQLFNPVGFFTSKMYILFSEAVVITEMLKKRFALNQQQIDDIFKKVSVIISEDLVLYKAKIHQKLIGQFLFV